MPIWLLAKFGFLRLVPSWLWKWIAIGLVLLVVFFYGFNKGSQHARAQCEAQAKRAQNAADAQDLAAERAGREQDLQITEALTQQKKVDDENIAKLQQQLAARVPKGKTDPCLYDKSTADPDDDAPPSRLRNRK